MKRVCGFDMHKSSIFECILNEDGISYQNKFRVLTIELERMAEVMHYERGGAALPGGGDPERLTEAIHGRATRRAQARSCTGKSPTAMRVCQKSKKRHF